MDLDNTRDVKININTNTRDEKFKSVKAVIIMIPRFWDVLR